MKTLLLLFLLIPLTASALDPMQPVAQEINGELVNFKKRLPSKWTGISNYRKAGDAQWTADSWVNVTESFVSVTNVVDRTAYTASYTNDLDGEVIGPQPVDPAYHIETNIIQRALSALVQINPTKDPVETLTTMKSSTPAEFNELAQARLADVSTVDEKINVLAGVAEILAIFAEVKERGLEWRSSTLGLPVTTNTTSTVVRQKVEE